MKNIWKMIIVILVAFLFLSACVRTPEEPIENEPIEQTPIEIPAEEQKDNPAEMEIIDKISYKAENGKFGFHKNGEPITEAIFDEVSLYEEKFDDKKVYVGKYTDGKRKQYAKDEIKAPYIKEIPNVLYYLMDEDGNLMNEKPLAYFCFSAPYGYGNATYDWFLNGTYDGDYYSYIKEKDGTFDLHYKESAGTYYIMTNRVNQKEYIQTAYTWNVAQIKHGLTDLEGNVILEDIYWNISAPYADRIFAYIGSSFQSEECVRLEIYDFEGNLINDQYNDVGQYGNGETYFLVAHCIGEDADEVCYDENGDVCETGYWFIDKSGNKLSERFEYIYVERFLDGNGGSWQYGKVTVTDENGKETEISTKPYEFPYD